MMYFDPNNPIVKLCAQGMECEGKARPKEALTLFQKAWDLAETDFEKLTAAHYLARHQKTIEAKLEWDIVALTFALRLTNDEDKATLPSLYLNIAKGYEDLNNFLEAEKYYKLAMSFTRYLDEDGYGKMIKTGIEKGLERINER